MPMDRLNRLLRKLPAWPLYIVGVMPPVWLLYQGLTGGLGAEPIRALEHELGRLALQTLIAGLCITPLKRFAGLNLMTFRRAVGLIAFAYVVLHLLVWLVLDVQLPERIWADILRRPYITVGMLSLCLLVPLAVTSNNLSIRRLGGRAWRRLHRLVYPAVFLAAVHFVMLAKGFQIEPLIYLLSVLALLLLRLPSPGRLVSRLRGAGRSA